MARIRLTQRCGAGGIGKVIETDDPEWFIKRNWGQYETGESIEAETREIRAKRKTKSWGKKKPPHAAP